MEGIIWVMLKINEGAILTLVFLINLKNGFLGIGLFKYSIGWLYSNRKYVMTLKFNKIATLPPAIAKQSGFLCAAEVILDSCIIEMYLHKK